MATGYHCLSTQHLEQDQFPIDLWPNECSYIQLNGKVLRTYWGRLLWLFYSTCDHTLHGIIIHPRMLFITRGRRASVIIASEGVFPEAAWAKYDHHPPDGHTYGARPPGSCWKVNVPTIYLCKTLSTINSDYKQERFPNGLWVKAINSSWTT